MSESVNRLKAGAAVLIAALTALWGWLGWLAVGWIALMVLDYLTGTCAAWRAGEWSSSRAREGIWHKVGSMVAVLTAGVLDLVIGVLAAQMPQGALPFPYTTFLCPLVVVWYLLTEAGSVIENAGALGAPVPAWLRKAIAALREQVDETM